MNLMFATIEHTIEKREHPYIIYWHTAVEGWKDDRNHSNSGNEDKAGKD